MHILFMSPEGDGFGVALALAREGNDVTYWTGPEHQLTGQGFDGVTVTTNWNKPFKTADFVLFDMVKMGKLATKMRALGKPVLGSHEWADAVELDRGLGQAIMKKTGATIPDYKEFPNIQAGVKFLEKADRPYVFKPVDNKNNAWTFVPKDGNDATISFMESLPTKAIPHILQEMIQEDTVEISTEGWFNGRKLLALNHTMEKKRLMAGDRGPQTGCMGNVVWMVPFGDKITEQLLKPLEAELTRVGYVGPIDINCMVGEKNAYFLEFTVRFGYDAIQTSLSLTDEKTKFLFGIASRSIDEHEFSPDFAVGVRLALSPYPHKLDKVEEVKGMRVIENPNFNFWPSDIYQEMREVSDGELSWQQPQWLQSGPVVGVQVATNETIDGARELVYKAIDELVISKDVMYRCDIAKDAQESIDTLKKWGWL